MTDEVQCVNSDEEEEEEVIGFHQGNPSWSDLLLSSSSKQKIKKKSSFRCVCLLRTFLLFLEGFSELLLALVHMTRGLGKVLFSEEHVLLKKKDGSAPHSYPNRRGNAG